VKVFVSYRRDDVPDFARSVSDRLKTVKGISSVFFDVQSLAPGQQFPKILIDEISQAEVVVVIIGDKWTGRERIQSDEDFVHIEIASALRLEKRIIPVLAPNSIFPKEGELPSPLKPLAGYNALVVSHVSFDRDLELLVTTIFQRFKGKNEPGLSRVLFRVFLGSVTGFIAFLLFALVNGLLTANSIGEPGSLSVLLGSDARVVLAGILFVAAGGFIFGMVKS
jgi:TIR domain